MERAIEFLKQRGEQHLEWARDLCRIPSISTQDEHKPDMRAAAEWTHALCEKIGFQTEIHETGGHPLVYAEWTGAPGAPTYLAYGHVDVQPTGDRALWDADPFDPVVKDGWLICRGSADDKGQVLLYLRAAQAWLETTGKLPINLKLLIENEEEIGSPNLAPFVEKYRDRLACDGILISDTGLFEDGMPTITTGTRGLCYKEVRVHGPRHDLHSGTGGPVVNPANALAKIIAGLHDPDGRVTVPGFYNDVVAPSQEERDGLARLPFNEAGYAAELGVSEFAGEKGWTVLELGTLRPTLDVNGIYGGYMKEGANTIIPASAGAKISMRLVPDQDPEKIGAAFEQAVHANCPLGVRVEVIHHAHVRAYVTPTDRPAVTAAVQALREAFGGEVAFIRSGGSLPILSMFQRQLGVDTVLLGFASPKCNAHGPNEKANLADLDRGAETIVRLLANLAECHDMP